MLYLYYEKGPAIGKSKSVRRNEDESSTKADLQKKIEINRFLSHKCRFYSSVGIKQQWAILCSNRMYYDCKKLFSVCKFLTASPIVLLK